MTYYDLQIGSEEQTINLLDGYSADIRFDPIYKRWYYNLYLYNTLAFAGVALVPDTLPLYKMSPHFLAIIDSGDPREDYEPYLELGGRLKLIEVVE